MRSIAILICVLPLFPSTTRAEILFETHHVAFGAYHANLTIIPENQREWVSNPDFHNTDLAGNVFITLGAGPKGWIARLVAERNRPKDIEARRRTVDQIKVILELADEDALITRLLETEKRYPDHLDYDLFPQNLGGGWVLVPDDGYNSNSFVAGLMRSVGLIEASEAKNPPEFEPPKDTTDTNLPGFQKPIPENRFEEEAQDGCEGGGSK